MVMPNQLFKQPAPYFSMNQYGNNQPSQVQNAPNGQLGGGGFSLKPQYMNPNTNFGFAGSTQGQGDSNMFGGDWGMGSAPRATPIALPSVPQQLNMSGMGSAFVGPDVSGMPGGVTGAYTSSLIPGSNGTAMNQSIGGDGGGILGGFLNKKNPITGEETQGWGGPAIGIANGLSSAYFGMKNYGLQKDALNESRRQWDANYAVQKSLTNSQLEDRQRARVAVSTSGHENVADYMKKYGVK